MNCELVSFLRALPAERLAVGGIGMTLNSDSGDVDEAALMHVAPTFDGDFFPQQLDELRKCAPLKPMLLGVTRYEGLAFCKVFFFLCYFAS